MLSLSNPFEMALNLSDSFTFSSDAFFIIVSPSAKIAAMLNIGISNNANVQNLFLVQYEKKIFFVRQISNFLQFCAK